MDLFVTLYASFSFDCTPFVKIWIHTEYVCICLLPSVFSGFAYRFVYFVQWTVFEPSSSLSKVNGPGDCHQLQVPGLSSNWWGFQAWDTLQDRTDDSSIDGAETSLEQQDHFSQFQDMTYALPCHIHLQVCLWIISRTLTAELKRRIQAMEMRCYCKISTYLIQGPCYQWGSLCQDQEGNRTTRRPPGHCKELQTALVWTYLPFIRFGQNHLVRRHSKRGEKTRQTETEVKKQH